MKSLKMIALLAFLGFFAWACGSPAVEEKATEVQTEVEAVETDTLDVDEIEGEEVLEEPEVEEL